VSRRRSPSALVAGLAALALLLFLALPLLALILATSPAAFIEGLRHPLTWPALWLSLRTTAAAMALILLLGTPLAWWLARTSGRAARLVEAIVQLPIVVPPAVAGLALLLTLGRRGLLGPAMERFGLEPAFTTVAVVIAQIFVGAPFYVQAASAAFASLDERLLIVARTLGASPGRVFLRIALPLSRRGLLAGAALAWTRALGEFGATLMFAGNYPGRTQTLPLAVYSALEVDLGAAQALSVLLVMIGFGVLLLLRGRLIPARPERRTP
jgi:molybdate transport system permease protein